MSDSSNAHLCLMPAGAGNSMLKYNVHHNIISFIYYTALFPSVCIVKEMNTHEFNLPI